jgi:ParB-like chromosome segregation protein Spo0J
VVSIDSARPADHNPRTHSAEQIDQIAKSITEFGFTIPILIDDDGVIIAGHGRHAAALKLGLLKIPVIRATGWTAEQCKAYMIADNKLALNAGWHAPALQDIINELITANFNIDVLGFSPDDLTRLATDADEALFGKKAEGPKPMEAEDGTDADGAVAFSLVMAADARRVVQDAMADAKEAYNLETGAEALVRICKEWRTTHGPASV